MADEEGYERRRVTWRHRTPPTAAYVAAALEAVAQVAISDEWTPERLIMTNQLNHFDISLDLAPEATSG